MGYKFLIFIVIVSVLQTCMCILNIEAPRRGRQNRFPESQSEEDALDYNVREGESSPNFDIDSFKKQLTSLSPQQIQQLVGLLSPEGAFGSQANGNNVDETKEENNENVLTNNKHDHNNHRRPNRRGGRRNGGRRDRRGRDGCNKNRGGYGAGTGYGIGRGDGNGQGYGAGMGYGSGSGVGEGNGGGTGFGMGQGYGAGNGIGTGMGGAGAGNGFGTGQGYESRGRRGSGYGIGRGSGGAGGNMLGFGAGGGYANEREPYDYNDTPSVSGTQGAMIGGGSEISGVKINSFAKPGNPSRMHF